ncbi:MAG: TIGR02710 family CRISPR-associated CARF protein [Nitrospirales bacterium]|nr:TIGR02710 family CRISPR-associated CARF protein [Nitrospirales bacterium]
MSAIGQTKALLIGMQADPKPAIATLRELTPDMVCFVLDESHKSVAESEIHPALVKMPQRWDWIVLPEIQSFASCHKTLARQLPSLLSTWGVLPGELVIDLTGSTSAMASAMTLVGFPFTHSIRLTPDGPSETPSGPTATDRKPRLSASSEENPWDEEAPRLRQEACQLFNQGAFEAAANSFHTLEHRISGGSKPMYRALADVANGYALWDQHLYRQAWEKLKGGIKALELAAVWGGPPGMDRLIKSLKTNMSFLERIVLDVKEIKPSIALDLLAWAKRRGDRHRELDSATRTLLRAMEAFSQSQLFAKHQIKSWDVNPDQLPESLRETCRTRYRNEIDGKYRLPLHGQLLVLDGFDDSMGRQFMRDWPKLKTLFDAADHSILGGGFEPIKAERFQQLLEAVLKHSGVTLSDLPAFPVFHLA